MVIWLIFFNVGAVVECEAVVSMLLQRNSTVGVSLLPPQAPNKRLFEDLHGFDPFWTVPATRHQGVIHVTGFV